MGFIQDRWHVTKDGQRIRTDRFGKGKRWRVRWEDHTGKEVTNSFATREAAVAHLASVTTDMVRGTYVDSKAANRITFNEQAKLLLKTKAHLELKSIATVESALRSRVLPYWGERTLASATHSEIASWLGSLPVSPSRRRQCLEAVRQMLDLAVKDRILSFNPANEVPRPRLPRREKKPLTYEEVERLAIECAPYSVVIRTLGYAGLRWGEMAALNVSDFDPITRRLHIRESMTEVNGKMVYSKDRTTKTKRARRAPLTQQLVDEIELMLEKRGEVKGDDPLFISPDGARLRNSNFKHRYFDPARDRAGLPKTVTPHVLRSTAISLAIAAGADVKVIQAMVGQSSAAVTLDIYADLYPDRLDEVTQAMDRRMKLAREGTHV